jgi:hypothetical protein
VAAVAIHEYRHFYFCSVTGRLQNGEILMNRETLQGLFAVTLGECKANEEYLRSDWPWMRASHWLRVESNAVIAVEKAAA